MITPKEFGTLSLHEMIDQFIQFRQANPLAGDEPVFFVTEDGEPTLVLKLRPGSYQLPKEDDE